MSYAPNDPGLAGARSLPQTTYDIRDFGALPARIVSDGAMASGAAPLVSATANFSQADVGQFVTVVTQPAAAVWKTVGAGTIVAVADSSHATVSFTNGTGGAVAGCYVAIGPDCTAAFNAAATAMAANINGGLCYVPDNTYLLATGPISLPNPTGINGAIAIGFVGQTPPSSVAWNIGANRPHQGGPILLAIWQAATGTNTGANIAAAVAGGGGGPVIVLHRLTVRNLPGVSITPGGLTGIDLFNAYNFNIEDLVIDVLAQAANLPTPSAANFPFGLRLPQLNNGAFVNGRRISIIGMGIGFAAIGEHANLDDIYCFDCLVGLKTNIMNHGARIGRALIQGCGQVLQADTGAAGKQFLSIEQLDVENTSPGGQTTTVHINDPNNLLWGDILLHVVQAGSGPTAALLVTGAANLHIKNNLVKPGSQTAPGVPAASTNFTNPFWRDAMVVITGGTGVAVTVDGVATGQSSGVFWLPSNKTINLGAYTVAPTWTWLTI